jgi:hypothetical protein
MRHVFGIVLAVAMAAALFFGAGWGVARIVALHSRGTGLTSTHGLAAVALVLGTGLLLGILLAVPAISPLGAGLPGLLLLGWSALFVVKAGSATRLIPLHGHAFAAGFGSMLGTGVLALAGATMVVPLFVPSRWRRGSDADDEDEDEDEDYYEDIGVRR